MDTKVTCIASCSEMEKEIDHAQAKKAPLAQAYLAHRTKAVKGLIISSTGPANYGKGWLPVEYVAMALARLLPEKTVKNLSFDNQHILHGTRRGDWLSNVPASPRCPARASGQSVSE